MADTTPQRRVLPARERRESAAKRMAHSPPPAPSPSLKKPATLPKTGPGSRGPRGPYKKRVPPTGDQATPSPARQKHQQHHQQHQAPISSTPLVPLDESAGLPTKLNENQPLPTIDTPQDLEKLSASEYQSVAESAVLAASLHRSQTMWLLDGLFDRYWTKPSKKKGAAAADTHNPDTKSMQKLGAVTVTIEPHTFEAMLYTVREPNPHPPPPIYRPPPPFPQVGGHPPPGGYPPFYNPPTRPLVPPSATKPTTGGTQPYPASSGSPHSNVITQPGSTGKSGNNVTRSTSTTSTPQAKKEGSTVPASQPSTPKPTTQRPDAPAASPKANADPVIQALATRAATDPELKDLMKQVATSQASQEQLRKFQQHIDELNALIQSKKELEKKDKPTEPTSTTKASTPAAPPPRPPSAQQTPPITVKSEEQSTSRTSTPGIAHALPPSSTKSTPLPPPALPPSTASTSGPPRPAPYPPYPPRTYPPPPFPPLHGAPPPHHLPPPKLEPRVKHMLIEFLSPVSPSPSTNTSSTTAANATSFLPPPPTRYHLPEHSILEFLPPPTPGPPIEMLCSFLVVRPSSWILSRGGDPAYYEKDKEYFEAVTMRVKAQNPRTLETWGKSARTLRECREWMEGVIGGEGKARGKGGWLVGRLPREEGKEVKEEGGVGRGRKGKDKEKEREENVDSGVEIVDDGDGDVEGEVAEEKFDDELRESYGVPYVG
ncbi:MAG: hypothetical protein Q9160_006945 [Pyrenula sp. 1 TL-2023]